jgi:hypothetical protein
MANLRQLARVADRLQSEVVRLHACIAALIEAEEQPPATPRRRSPRWVGPVPDKVRAEREEAFLKYFTLALNLGRDPTRKYFAVLHNLSVSEVSRWLSNRPRGIRPGSATDESIWRALNQDIRRLEACEAKRHGRVENSNCAPPISSTMAAWRPSSS